MNKNEKISKTLKEKYAKGFENPMKGKPGRKPSEEERELKRRKNIEFWDKKGRVSDTHKKARNKANVYAYRARLRNAIPNDADLSLIRKIYENCPEGYHVDHIIALAANGKHHQNNLQYLPITENCKKGKGVNYDKEKALRWQDFI